MFRPSVLLPSRLACLLLSLIALHGWAHARTNEPETSKLEVGKHFERQIAGTEIHSYQRDLVVDQFAEVTVDQRGIDLVLWTYDHKGPTMEEVDAFRSGDSESIILVGEIAGPYR